MVAVDLVWGNRAHLAVDGVGIHVERAGPEGGPTLVCLHGFASGTFTWAGVAGHLRDDMQILAWDRPPFGRSDRPAPRRGDGDPYAVGADLRRSARLVELLGEGAEPLVLVGHSAGALLAVQLALDGVVAPDALVLVAPAIEAAPPAAVRALSQLPAVGLVGASLLRVGVRGAATVLRRSTRHGTPLTEATAVEAGRCLRAPGTAEALWHLTATWEPPQVVGRLAELDLPALVIGGVDDRIVSEAQHRTAAEGLGASLHLLPGAGHAPHEQQPALVAGLIRDLVSTI